MKRIRILIIVAGIFFYACNTTTSDQQNTEIPQGNADVKSAAIAEDIMTAMGGHDKWQDLHYISWTFFGARQLVWDKIGGRVRIDNPRDTSVYLINLNKNSGRYARKGVEITEDSILTEKVKQGTGIWINDSYWLVMPFKLRDEGVNLKYMREDTMSTGMQASVLELTFEGVGNTPENKYEVYVDPTDNLIKQWDFYAKSSQEAPSRSWPWDNYKDFDGLLISTDRSDNSGPSNVKVYAQMDDKVFESFDRFDY